MPESVASFNIKVFLQSEMGEHKADRLHRENSLFRHFCRLLQRFPSLTLQKRAAACPTHWLWPHYAATYTRLWWELLPCWREKKLQFTFYIYTDKHHMNKLYKSSCWSSSFILDEILEMIFRRVDEIAAQNFTYKCSSHNRR